MRSVARITFMCTLFSHKTASSTVCGVTKKVERNNAVRQATTTPEVFCCPEEDMLTRADISNQKHKHIEFGTLVIPSSSTTKK